jgi:hypothetical protein
MRRSYPACDRVCNKSFGCARSLDRSLSTNALTRPAANELLPVSAILAALASGRLASGRGFHPVLSAALAALARSLAANGSRFVFCWMNLECLQLPPRVGRGLHQWVAAGAALACGAVAPPELPPGTARAQRSSSSPPRPTARAGWPPLLRQSGAGAQRVAARRDETSQMTATASLAAGPARRGQTVFAAVDRQLSRGSVADRGCCSGDRQQRRARGVLAAAHAGSVSRV